MSNRNDCGLAGSMAADVAEEAQCPIGCVDEKYQCFGYCCPALTNDDLQFTANLTHLIIHWYYKAEN